MMRLRYRKGIEEAYLWDMRDLGPSDVFFCDLRWLLLSVSRRMMLLRRYGRWAESPNEDDGASGAANE